MPGRGFQKVFDSKGDTKISHSEWKLFPCLIVQKRLFFLSKERVLYQKKERKTEEKELKQKRIFGKMREGNTNLRVSLICLVHSLVSDSVSGSLKLEMSVTVSGSGEV